MLTERMAMLAGAPDPTEDTAAVAEPDVLGGPGGGVRPST